MSAISFDQTINSPTISYLYGYFKSKYYKLMNYYISDPNPNEMHEMFPRIYISDLKTALSESVLNRHGITHIISAVIGTEGQHVGNRKCVYFPLMDNTSEDISSHFDKTNQYISDTLSSDPNNKILIHCMVGASRSATLIASYICYKTNFKVSDILKYMKSKRKIVSPNPNFVRQLEEYEKSLCGESL